MVLLAEIAKPPYTFELLWDEAKSEGFAADAAVKELRAHATANLGSLFVCMYERPPGQPSGSIVVKVTVAPSGKKLDDVTTMAGTIMAETTQDCVQKVISGWKLTLPAQKRPARKLEIPLAIKAATAR